MADKKKPAAGGSARGSKEKAPSSKTEQNKNTSSSTKVQFVERLPERISQLLFITDGRAYALAALPTKIGTAKPKPLVVAVRDDGALYSVRRIDHDDITGTLDDIGISIEPGAYPFDETLSPAGIRRLWQGYHPSAPSVFFDVFGVFDTHMDFNKSLADQRTMCELLSCYAMATYFTPIFDVVGYLWFTGAPGSGKTQALGTASELVLLGRLFLSASSFAATRDASNWGSTIAFDDSEIIEDPNKREMILAGCRRGAKVTIKHKDKDGDWESIELNIFCHRMFSAIQRPDPTLASRCIIIPIVRSNDGKKTLSDPHEHSKWPVNRTKLIDDLWMLALTNLVQMRVWYEKAAERVKLRGRDLDPWRGILTVALWLQEEHGVEGLFDRMNRLSVAYQQERASLESGADSTRLIIRCLLDMFKKEKAAIIVFDATEVSKQVNTLARESGLVDDSAFTSPKSVGWVLRSLRIDRAPKGKTHRRWQASRDSILSLAEAYAIPTHE